MSGNATETRGVSGTVTSYNAKSWMGSVKCKLDGKKVITLPFHRDMILGPQDLRKGDKVKFDLSTEPRYFSGDSAINVKRISQKGSSPRSKSPKKPRSSQRSKSPRKPRSSQRSKSPKKTRSSQRSKSPKKPRSSQRSKSPKKPRSSQKQRTERKNQKQKKQKMPLTTAKLKQSKKA